MIGSGLTSFSPAKCLLTKQVSRALSLMISSSKIMHPNGLNSLGFPKKDS